MYYFEMGAKYANTADMYRGYDYVDSAQIHIDNCENLIETFLAEIGVETPEVTPTLTPTPTPQEIKDSDGDGVPDDYDYAPNDPNVQSQADVKTPGFDAIFAICSLLAIAVGLRRRR